MKYQLLGGDTEKTFVLVLEAGDEVTEELLRFADENDVGAARLSGIGAVSGATVAFFDPDSRRYIEADLPEQMEVLSLSGNLARYQGQPRLHAHVVLSKPDGTTLGGHLTRATVRPTLEVMVTVSPEGLERRDDPVSGLPLIGL